MTYEPGTWKRLAPGYYQHVSGAVIYRVIEHVRLMRATAKGVKTSTTRRQYWCADSNKFDTAADAMAFVETTSTDPKGHP